MKFRPQFASAFPIMQKKDEPGAMSVNSSRSSAGFRSAMQEVMEYAGNSASSFATLTRGIPMTALRLGQRGDNDGRDEAYVAAHTAGAEAPAASSQLLIYASSSSGDAGAHSGSLAESGQGAESPLHDGQLGPSLADDGILPASPIEPESRAAVADDHGLAGAKQGGGVSLGSLQKKTASKDAVEKTAEGGANALRSGEAIQPPTGAGAVEMALVSPTGLPVEIPPPTNTSHARGAAATEDSRRRQPVALANNEGQVRPALNTTSFSQQAALPGGVARAAAVILPGAANGAPGKTQPSMPERDDASVEIRGSTPRLSEGTYPGNGNAMPSQALHVAANSSERRENATEKPSDKALLSGSSVALPPAEQHVAVQHGAAQIGSAQPSSAHVGSAPVPAGGVAGSERAPADHRMQSDGLRSSAGGDAATQVLSRMDAAPLPASLVALRADARHLDVGVASSSLGWVEIRASASASGGIDAALHVQSDATAHALAGQTREIADYAREHAVPLGQLSVDVGTGGGGARRDFAGRDASAPEQGGRGSGSAPTPSLEDTSAAYGTGDAISLISLRA